jgi:predicted anti-sigma-YlaC factor YlaD
MRCSEATRYLQLYIDSRLTLKQLRALEAHLSHCPPCRAQCLLLQEITSTLGALKPVAEPPDLTAQIMQRVAMTSQQRRRKQYSLLRPSLLEWLVVVVLATITTLGAILEQPSLRAVLPFINGHGSLSEAISNTLDMLVTGNAGPLTLVLWVGGTLIGVCITLALVGNEIRTAWFKAMLERLPVR